MFTFNFQYDEWCWVKVFTVKELIICKQWTTALNWKKMEAHAIGARIKNMAQCMSMEILTCILKNNLGVYEEIS